MVEIRHLNDRLLAREVSPEEARSTVLGYCRSATNNGFSPEEAQTVVREGGKVFACIRGIMKASSDMAGLYLDELTAKVPENRLDPSVDFRAVREGIIHVHDEVMRDPKLIDSDKRRIRDRCVSLDVTLRQTERAMTGRLVYSTLNPPPNWGEKTLPFYS